MFFVSTKKYTSSLDCTPFIWNILAYRSVFNFTTFDGNIDIRKKKFFNSNIRKTIGTWYLDSRSQCMGGKDRHWRVLNERALLPLRVRVPLGSGYAAAQSRNGAQSWQIFMVFKGRQKSSTYVIFSEFF